MTQEIPTNNQQPLEPQVGLQPNPEPAVTLLAAVSEAESPKQQLDVHPQR
jgi:hypothetical protein